MTNALFPEVLGSRFSVLGRLALVPCPAQALTTDAVANSHYCCLNTAWKGKTTLHAAQHAYSDQLNRLRGYQAADKPHDLLALCTVAQATESNVVTFYSMPIIASAFGSSMLVMFAAPWIIGLLLLLAILASVMLAMRTTVRTMRRLLRSVMIFYGALLMLATLVWNMAASGRG